MVNIWLLYGYYMVNNKLVGGVPTPLRNDGVSSSVGMMKFQTERKNKINVPNHQTDNDKLFSLHIWMFIILIKHVANFCVSSKDMALPHVIVRVA